MSINYGYYLPLADDIYETVRFLDISVKTAGIGKDATQQIDTATGDPKWTVAALVSTTGGKRPETELFTLVASEELAHTINELPQLAPIRLQGLASGKWSKVGKDTTTWSFQITGVEVIK